MPDNSKETVIRQNLKRSAYIFVGCLLGACVYPLFLVPNSIAPGGLTGFATILNHLFQLPVGMTSLALNVPLFLIGYKSMGRGFVLRTLFATLLFSALIDLMKFPPLTSDPLLASLFGGALLGFGLGLILRGQATTGGTDLIAQVVHRRFPYITVGVFLMAIDCLVILMAGFIMGAEQAMYAMICVFCCSKTLDVVLAGIGTDKAFHIITKNGIEMTQRLLSEIGRGVTKVQATGGFSNTEVQMLICVVTRVEMMSVKSIVHETDPHAFVFITDTHETLGEGFRNLMEENGA